MGTRHETYIDPGGSGGGSATRNDGQVKINTGNGLRPVWPNGGLDSIDSTWQRIEYAFPLGLSSFPTTSWPATVPAPVDADIYDSANDTFLENPQLGQVHTWRLQFQFNKQGAGTALEIQLRNTLSGFEIDDFKFFSSGFTTGFFIANFISIADGASLPAPDGTGQGYEFRVRADNNAFQQSGGHFLEVTSLTRVSHHYALPR